jgi:hypothetical protein
MEFTGSLKTEKTHHLDVELEDGAGKIRLSLTISGCSGSDSITDLQTYNSVAAVKKEKALEKYR